MELRLMCPFFVEDKKTEERVLVDSVIIKRVYATDLSRLKGVISSASQNMRGLTITSKEICDMFVDKFLSGSSEVEGYSNNALIMRMPFMNVVKINLFGMMLMRETSLVTTAYKCDACDKTTMFDLDPEYPVPADVEEERDFMENFLDFYKEKRNKDLQEGIKVDLKTNPVRLEDSEGKPVDMVSMSIRWPTVGDYIRSSGDKKRSSDIELWTAFDCITHINDYTEEETKSLKNLNGIENVMKIRQGVYEKLLSDLNQFAMEMEHTFTCKHCGTENEQPFDYSNFFDYRRS